MHRWVGRVALVTGASSGIGYEIAKSLVKHGMKVVGCSRNTATIQELAKELEAEKGTLTPIVCDVSKEDEVISMFENIKSTLGGVDVCVNNAGVCHDAPLLTGQVEQWRSMFEINVLGLCICTRESVKSMKERNVDDGQVIQINSAIGHRPYPDNPGGNFYSATKYAVTGLVEGLRKELLQDPITHIRVTSLSPGLTETEFAYRMYEKNPEKAKMKYSQFENLKAVDIADGVIYVLSVPKHVQIHELSINPTEMKI